MIVVKCDKCGKYIDKQACDLPHIKYAIGICFGIIEHEANLCEECYADFLEWLKVNKDG